MTDDGSRLFYSRADTSGLHAKLYEVDSGTPGVSHPIGGTPSATLYGVQSVSAAHNGSYVMSATLDSVPVGGGVSASGSWDVSFVPMSAPNAPTLLKHFVGGASFLAQAPDDSFTVVGGADTIPGGDMKLYFINPRDLAHLIPIAGAPASAPVGVPQTISNF